jgi:hypothetical protein
MSYEFDIVEVQPVTLAVCETFTKQSTSVTNGFKEMT